MGASLSACDRFDSAGPSPHPSCHSASEKKRESQVFAPVSGPTHGVATQLLIVGCQILPSGQRIAGPVQRGFF